MATKELRELRHKYKAAYTSYMHCVQALSDASQTGVVPSAAVLELEEKAFDELTVLRQALLDALQTHGVKANKTGLIALAGRTAWRSSATSHYRVVAAGLVPRGAEAATMPKTTNRRGALRAHRSGAEAWHR